ncbi:MAG: Rieske 2Fe-2S domain-containing protein [Rubrivivax sp.]|nr:Rieske 2Fe-2S domain-containing protein [Rubrivivax sp.]
MADAPPPAPGTAVAGQPPQRLCRSDELAERGRALVWDVLVWGRPARAFALRFDGKAVAYLNRCVHVPTEMDWQEGEFLDIDRRWILCSIHGAAYEPADGRCVGGPCGRGRLTPVAVAERDGEVYWYPSRDVVPVPFDDAPPTTPGLVPGALPAAAPAIAAARAGAAGTSREPDTLATPDTPDAAPAAPAATPPPAR